MDFTLAMISALWPMFTGIGMAFLYGVIRSEKISWRVRHLEIAKEENDREMYALRLEVQAINNQIVKELNEIRESLAWIKGRFAREQPTTSYNQNHFHEEK